MKSFKVLFLIIFSVILLSISGCKKHDPTPPTVEEQQLAKLSQTWKITAVTLDGVDKKSAYPGFTLILSGTPNSADYGYTTTRPAGSTTPWLAGGRWVYGADPLADIIRDKGTADELAMKYSVTDTQLQVSFNFTGAGYTAARTSVVKGAWVFTFQL